MTLLCSIKTTVRFLINVSMRGRPDNHIVALIKLGHVVAGIYMCVHPRTWNAQDDVDSQQCQLGDGGYCRV
jgi:hypothetical protein